MKINPMITVAIPAYNAEKHISMAIKSVLSQTYSDFELIITDDGSTDGTLDIIKSFSDNRIRIVSDGINAGISVRLNQQIDLAKGCFFARMDADDIMMPDRLERQLAFMSQNPDVDAIGGSAIIIDDNNKIIGQRHVTIPRRLSLDYWAQGGAFIHPTVFGKMDFFRKYHYSTAFRGVEDRHLWMRASQSANLWIVPEYYMFYREPLKFKLSTYLFRCKQNRKLLKLPEIKSYFGKKKQIKELCSSYVRSLAAVILSTVHLDFLMIAMRNRPIVQVAEYEKILQLYGK